MPAELCRYFLKGACTRDDCPFSHDTRGSQPQNVCRWFLAGNCRYGSSCRYDHVKPKTSPTRGGGDPRRAPRGPAPQHYGHPGGAPQQWGGPHAGAYYQGPGGYAQHAGGQPGNWAGVAGMYTPAAHPGGGAGGGFEPTDEELSWLEAEMAAASGGGGGARGGGGASNEMGLTEEEWAMLEAEMDAHDKERAGGAAAAAAAGAAGDNLDSPELSPEELAWLQGELGAEELGDMLSGMSMGGDAASSGPASAAGAAPGAAADAGRSSVADLIKASADVECSVCMEKVLEKPAVSSRRFGLLNKCDHPFCIDCVRAWRGSGDAKTTMARECPMCRVTSHFTVPSAYYAKSPEKERVIEAYKAKCAGIHCVHFKRGEATCPFGTSCFYRHELPDGTLVSERPRYRAGADGDAAPVKPVKISDFLDAREGGAAP